MKKFLALAALALAALPAHAQRTTELPAASGVTADDLTIIVNSPSSNPQTQKATGAQIATFVLSANADLSSFLALLPSDDDVLQRKAGAWVNRSLAQLAADLAGSFNFYGPGGTDVAVADGGTGASTAANARTNLGLAIGSAVQAWDTDLDSWATKTAPAGTVLGSNDIGGSVQAWDADLDSWATKTAPAGTVVGTTDSQTLTNKSISGGQITSAVANATLAAGATALAANGTNCSAGSYAGGVDASGNAEGCTVAATGTGDVSSNTASSVDSEIALFSGTGGKTIKRATGSGLAKLTSGVLSAAASGTDYVVPGGNVATATALAANGANCSAGGAAGGVNASGAAESCLAIGTDLQAWDADLDTWATKTAPAGAVVGTSDSQTLTNKSIVATQLTGTLQAGQFPALTGDVTTSAGALATTIAAGAVTDAKGSLATKPAVTVVATSNQALTGTPTIDSQATAVGSLILLTAQSAGAENGPWVAAAGAWSRPSWYPAGGTTQAVQFLTTLVRLGATYQGTTWRMTTAAPVTIDTTATTWAVTPLALNATTTTGLPVGANPSASAGLSAVNGSATTFLRSDGAPAIDQSIVPTWTGIHTWSLAEPRLKLSESDQAADEKLWDWDLNSKLLTLRTRTDADGTGVDLLRFTRGTGTAAGGLTMNVGSVVMNNATLSVGGGISATAGSITATTTAPVLRVNESDQGTDLKVWQWGFNNAIAKFATLTDANATGKDAITITRGTTTAIADVSLGNASDNPTFNWLGVGAASFGGALTSTGTLGASAVRAQGSAPVQLWGETDQGTDLKNWVAQLNGAVWTFSTSSDAAQSTPVKDAIKITRGATTTVSNVSLGNASDNPTFTWLGTGTASFGGALSTTSSIAAGRVSLSSATAVAVGINNPGTNRLGFYSNTALQGEFDATGRLKTNSGRQRFTRIVTAAGAITAATSDDIIGVNKTVGAATTVDLFTCAAANQGQEITVKDVKADAATNNITIDPSGAETIDGAATEVISTNRGARTFFCDATNGWQITAVK